jgi:hypothetical protein
MNKAQWQTGYEASWQTMGAGKHVYHCCDGCGASVIGYRLHMAYFPEPVGLCPLKPHQLMHRWWVGDCCRDRVKARLEPYLALEALK